MVLLNVNPPSVNTDASAEIDEIDEIKFPPFELDSDEPPLESDLYREQIDLLIRLLKYWWRDRTDIYVSGNLTIYRKVREIESSVSSALR